MRLVLDASSEGRIPYGNRKKRAGRVRLRVSCCD